MYLLTLASLRLPQEYSSSSFSFSYKSIDVVAGDRARRDGDDARDDGRDDTLRSVRSCGELLPRPLPRPLPMVADAGVLGRLAVPATADDVPFVGVGVMTETSDASERLAMSSANAKGSGNVST